MVTFTSLLLHARLLLLSINYCIVLYVCQIFSSIPILIRTSAGSLPKCGFIPLWRQSFRRVSWKSAGDCMRKTNKSPKILYSAMVREVEKWSGIRIHDRITTKVDQFFRLVGTYHNSKFQWDRLVTDAVIEHTDRQWQNVWQTCRPDRMKSTLVGVGVEVANGQTIWYHNGNVLLTRLLKFREVTSFTFYFFEQINRDRDEDS